MSIDIPPELWFLFVLALRRFPALRPTPEDFTTWLVYCIYKLYMLRPEVYGFKEALVAYAKEGGIANG